MGIPARSTFQPSARPHVAPSGPVVALYDRQFVLRAYSEGIRAFFAGWAAFNDDCAVVPAAAAAFASSQWGRCRDEGGRESIGLLLPDLLVAVCELRGDGGTMLAVRFARYAVRDPIRSATRRFQLTPREAEVLKLLLRGLRAAEIAHRLGLSEMTIADYGKRLRLKTRSRTQSGMIAALLGWDASGPARLLDPEDAR
jgi:DNA-binding CsgD family transcriptional regulator